MTINTPNLSSDTTPLASPSRARTRLSLVTTLSGLLIFLIGLRPALFGLDRSPVIGIVQISVFVVGLGVICLGGYVGLKGFWKNGNHTIAAEFGSRLVATGYVVAVFSAMADVFGMGTQSYPTIPLFGPWQAGGVQLGQAFIMLGFILLLPFKSKGQPAV